MSDVFPLVMSSAGAQQTPPTSLLAALIALAASMDPGLTANLPGSLIEDVTSTEVAGLALANSAMVELVNSLTPYGANAFLLSQLGQIYLGQGTAPAVPTNTSVYVEFTAVDALSNPLAGVVIGVGFTVSDGTYQYTVQDGGVTSSDGTSPPLFCLAVMAGSWSVPANTVTQLASASPPGTTLTCTNPEPGAPGGAAETEEAFRVRVLQAGQAISQGMPTTLRTYLEAVPGVQPNLVSIRQQTNGWEIIVGGSGDPYQIADAIYEALFDVSSLVGSTLGVVSITQAADGVVTTNLNHGYTTGQAATINGIVGMTPLNGVPFTVTVINETSFSIGIDTAGYAAYVSGGVVTPNLRNQSISILDYPDTYTVPFIVPPQQTVTMTATWATTSSNFVSGAAVAQMASAALAAYVNAIPVGQPMNLLVMNQTFLAAIANILPASQVSSLVFTVAINGIDTEPTGDLVIGDVESYFVATTSGITVIEA